MEVNLIRILINNTIIIKVFFFIFLGHLKSIALRLTYFVDILLK